MKLLCSHKIQKWLTNNDVLHLDNIHSHWHLEQVMHAFLFINSWLQIVNSLVICSQKCSQDVCEQNWVKNSTQWDLLIFELVKRLGQEQQWDCEECEECEEQQKWEQWEKEQWEREQTQGAEQSQEIFEDHFDVFSLNF